MPSSCSWRPILRTCSRSNQRNSHHRSTNDRVVERATPVGQPVGRSDGHLHSPTEPSLSLTHGCIDRIPVGDSQHQQVDIADRSVTFLARVSRRPRPVDVCRVDAVDGVEGLADHPGHAEGLDEDVGQSVEVGARLVGPNKSRPSDESARQQAGRSSTFDLAMNRRVRNPCPFGEFDQAVLGRRLTQDEREQLRLLLGAEDRQERWCRSSIHELDDISQFVRSRPDSSQASAPRPRRPRC